MPLYPEIPAKSIRFFESQTGHSWNFINFVMIAAFSLLPDISDSGAFSSSLRFGFNNQWFDDDFLPFRDVINEYYAKAISKKIKSTFKAKGEGGKPVASSLSYGYLKDSEDKNEWVIDEVAAPIVRRIFRMTLEGYGPYQIAAQLSSEHIPVPAYHQAQLGVGLW